MTPKADRRIDRIAQLFLLLPLAPDNKRSAIARELDELSPRCFCGARMTPTGFGIYPYHCEIRDRKPHAMVFMGCEAGHTCWSV